jgi:hypothetical protein
MGTWATSYFGNDDAIDWIENLRLHGFAAISTAINQVVDSREYLELPHAQQAIAAIAVFAAMVGRLPAPCLPGEATEIIQRVSLPADLGRHIEAAQKALKAILQPDSELNELWSENAENYEEWLSTIAQLQTLLSAPTLRPL